MDLLEFRTDYPLADLRPADYNPRFLSEKAFKRLRASIDRHGIIKPVIVNANGTLVAGHQRTKALLDLGHTTVPAVSLRTTVRMLDEVRFNLLHNRVELEASDVDADPGSPGAWSVIPWQSINVREVKNAAFVQAMGDMCNAHGPWGSVVMDDQGRIFLNAEYAVVAAQMKFDLLAWTCTMADAGAAYTDLTGEYGVYDWSNIDAPAYNQHIVQPRRLRARVTTAGKGEEVQYRSQTWDKLVMPTLLKADRVVDFGSGHGDYVKHLRGEGYDVHEYEPYRTTPGKYAVDIKAVVAMIRDLERELAHGLFDVVVLDSVVNATTSVAFQDAVLTMANALVAADGVVAIGTRGLYARKISEQANTAKGTGSRLSFLDKDNVELKFVGGKWQTLRFHTPESLTELLAGYFTDVQVIDRTEGNIKAVCRGPLDLGVERYAEAADTEFNMPYPNDYQHNRHQGAVDALLAAVAARGQPPA